MRQKILLVARLLLVSVLTIAWFAPPAQAEVLTVSGPTDFWFTVPEPTQFQVRAYAVEYGIDSHLWLYDEAGNLLAANDDWFGLDSWLDVALQTGSYRLRAGVCCGNPDAWYGTSYTIDINVSPIPPPTTTTLVEETTTTTEVPVTDPPPTDPPVTDPPPTDPPVTEPPATDPPVVTDPPQTTTEAPPTTIEVPTTTEPRPRPKPTDPPEETWPPTTESIAPTTMPTTTAPITTAPATTEAPSTPTSSPSSMPSETPSSAPTAPAPATPEETESPSNTSKNNGDAVSTSVVTTTSVDVPTATSLAPSATPFDTAPPADASDEEKEAFEAQVDLFSGAYDDYVPLGSTITVAQRRVVIAATAVMFILPAPTSRRRT